MLGARIAALRRHAGLSQAELAARLGVSASAVGMYEQGRREPSGALLVALAQLFQVSTDFLLTGTNLPAEQLTDLVENRLEAAGLRHRPEGLSRQELAVLLTAILTNDL